MVEESAEEVEEEEEEEERLPLNQVQMERPCESILSVSLDRSWF